MTQPKRAQYDDRLYNVGVRITGQQKNLIIEHAEKLGIPVSQLIEYAVWQFIREDKGIPAPGTAQYRIPNQQDQ
jgi:hypothetical protein